MKTHASHFLASLRRLCTLRRAGLGTLLAATLLLAGCLPDVTNITSTTARLTTIDDRGSEPSDYWFEYGLTQDYDHTTGSAYQNNYVDIAGLKPGTLYHYRLVMRVYPDNHMEYSNDATFTTLAGTYRVTTNADDGSGTVTTDGHAGTVDDPFIATTLRAALAATNARLGTASIVFDPALAGQAITLNGTELEIAANVTITGLGANLLAVDGNQASRVFHLDPGTTVAISALTIQNGSTASAGGIYNQGAALSLSNCTLQGNSATDGAGGGIFSEAGAGSASLTITNSTLSGNSSPVAGGSIYASASTVRISNSTFSGNSAPSGGGIYGHDATVEFGNTIFNTSALGGSGGTITSWGYNLSSDGGGGFLTGPGDLVNTDPKLGPLQDNGGPTFTHALLAGSPAIDQGKRDTIPALATASDQRGEPRPYDHAAIRNLGTADGDGTDIGAYEAQAPTAPAEPTVATQDATLASATGAQFNGTVNANGISTEVSFDYGTDTNYLSNIAASQTPLTGSTDTAVSATPALAEYTTYHFRAVATVGDQKFYGSDFSFRTLDVTPPTLDVSGVKLGYYHAGDALPDFTNVVTSTDNSAGVVTVTQSPANGTLTEGLFQVSFTATDPSSNSSAPVVVFLAVLPASPETDLLTGSGDAVATTPGIPSPGSYLRFGVPSINRAGALAFQTTINSPTGQRVLIAAGAPPVPIATAGLEAPGAGSNFATLSDPLLNDDGQVAFIGWTQFLLSSAGVHRIYLPSRPGIFTTVSAHPNRDAQNGGPPASGALHPIVIAGDHAPNVPGAPNARFDIFQELAFEGDTIVFSSTLLFTPGLTPSVWRWTPAGGLELLASTGQTFSGRKIRSLVALGAVGGSPGHGRSFHGATFAATVLFTNGTSALAHFQATGPLIVDLDSTATFDYEANAGTFTAGTWKSLFQPCLTLPPASTNSLLAPDTIALTFLGKFIPGAGAHLAAPAPTDAIFVHQVRNTGRSGPGVTARPTLATTAVAAVGDAVYDAAGTVPKGRFKSFSDPVSAFQPGAGGLQVAGLAVLAAPATLANDQFIFQSTARPGASRLLAREGDAAPGTAGKFSRFTFLALPAWEDAGPLFVATLVAGTKPVPSAEALGLWSAARDGTVQLALRTGSTMTIGSQTRKLTNFTVLGPVPNSDGQTRAYSAHQVAVRAEFGPGYQAILTITVP